MNDMSENIAKEMELIKKNQIQILEIKSIINVLDKT